MTTITHARPRVKYVRRLYTMYICHMDIWKQNTDLTYSNISKNRYTVYIYPRNTGTRIWVPEAYT